MVPDANRPAELSISSNIDEPPVAGQGVDRRDIAARSEIALAHLRSPKNSPGKAWRSVISELSLIANSSPHVFGLGRVPMSDGLPTSDFVSIADAAQWLACGTALSLRPNWRHEEEHAFFQPQAKCAAEMSAASDEGRPFPYSMHPFASPAEVVATLDANRGNWPDSGPTLYHAAIAAAAAGVKKDRQIQDENSRLTVAWQVGEFDLYGLSELTGQFELIPRSVVNVPNEWEDADIEMRDSDMFRQPAGSPTGFSQSPIYRAVVIERAALINWAGRWGTDTSAEAEGVPPSGEGMGQDSSEEGPPQQMNADTEQVSANAEAPVNAADIAERGSSDTAEAPIEAEIAGRRSTQTPEGTSGPLRTGLAGRPPLMSMHFILPEAQRRCACGDIPGTLKEFAEQLIAWFLTTEWAKKGYPEPAAGSLENSVRELYNSTKTRLQTGQKT
jgi:hypothetical protein